MLAALLRRRGIAVEVLSVDQLAGERMDQVMERRPAVVCVSAAPPHAILHARYVCLRLRARYPDLILIAGVWQSNEDAVKVTQRLDSSVVDYVVTTFAAALDRITSLTTPDPTPAPATEKTPVAAQVP